MKRLIIFLLLLSGKVFAQGGPNGPPNPACNGPNPPPWCDTPGVPIDNWQLMLLLILSGAVLGFIQIKKMKKSLALLLLLVTTTITAQELPTIESWMSEEGDYWELVIDKISRNVTPQEDSLIRRIMEHSFYQEEYLDTFQIEGVSYIDSIRMFIYDKPPMEYYLFISDSEGWEQEVYVMRTPNIEF